MTGTLNTENLRKIKIFFSFRINVGFHLKYYSGKTSEKHALKFQTKCSTYYWKLSLGQVYLIYRYTLISSTETNTEIACLQLL